MTYLSVQLRESAPYLEDAGRRETAALLIAAAEEIEALNLKISELEAQQRTPTSRERLMKRVRALAR